MPNYYSYLMRHGEVGVQEIVERIERYEGICCDADASLEDRWMAAMGTVERSSLPLAA